MLRSLLERHPELEAEAVELAESLLTTIDGLAAYEWDDDFVDEESLR